MRKLVALHHVDVEETGDGERSRCPNKDKGCVSQVAGGMRQAVGDMR